MTTRSWAVLDVVVRRESESAWGIEDPDKPGGIIWLPKSQVQIDDVKHPSKCATLTCPEWLAIEKGLV